MTKKFKYLFGPVKSRRLGISLGIDLVPYKTCSIDCVYCECGATTDLTLERKEYVSTKEVLKELDEYLSKQPKLDFITFSGSGEPTLHIGIGEIIEHIKKNYSSYKVAVLTNGTLLDDQKVCSDILKSDVVIPSFDAVSENVFEKILRPAEIITAKKVIDGIKNFNNQYNGKLILEIFLIPGVNDTVEELTKIKQVCMEIGPHAIQLNSLDRPGAEDWVEPMSKARLKEIREFLHPLFVQLIEISKHDISNISEHSDVIQTILSLIERRPSTVDDISFTIGLSKVEVEKILNHLVEIKKINSEKKERGTFYKLLRS